MLNNNQDLEKVIHFVMEHLCIDLNQSTSIADSSNDNTIDSYQPSPTEAPLVAEPMHSAGELNAKIKLIHTLTPKIDCIGYALNTAETCTMPHSPSVTEPTNSFENITTSHDLKQNISLQNVANSQPISNSLAPNTFSVTQPNTAQVPFSKSPNVPSPFKEINSSNSHLVFQNLDNNSEVTIPVPPLKKSKASIKSEKELPNINQGTQNSDLNETLITQQRLEQLCDQMQRDLSSTGFEDQQVPMETDCDSSEEDLSHQESFVHTSTQIQSPTKTLTSHQQNGNNITAATNFKSNSNPSFTIFKMPKANQLSIKKEVIDIDSQDSSKSDQTFSNRDPNYTELVKSAIVALDERKGSTIRSITRHIIDNNKVTR